MAASHALPSPSNVPLLSKEAPATPSTPGATITELPASTTASQDHVKRPNMRGALPDILMGAFLPCVPVALVSSLLLTLIFYNEVKLDLGYDVLRIPTKENILDPSVVEELAQLKSTGGTSAYYTDINPAVLATIAAWTSKIIPFITSSSMAVVAFFAGRRILDATRNSKTGQLPTPHQISILINLLSGSGFRPLYDTVVYWVKSHESLVQPIPLAFGALSFVVLNTLLIGAADTWFAASTKPEVVELLTRIARPEASYGRTLSNGICNATNVWQTIHCPSGPQSFCQYPCSITSWNATTEREGVRNAEQAARALFGNDLINTVLNTSYHLYDSGYDSQQFYFLGDVRPAQNIDFLANSTSVTTQCRVITQDCAINNSSGGFSCPGGHTVGSFRFSGAVGIDEAESSDKDTAGTVGIQFFKDAGLQDPVGFTSEATDLFSAQNPIHFLTWSRGFPPVDLSSNAFDTVRKEGALQADLSGDNVFILNCTSTIHKITYAWVNGTILQESDRKAIYRTRAPDIYGAIYSAPFAINSALGKLSLQEAAALAAYKNTSDGIAMKFANEFSRSAVALTAGVMSPQRNICEQRRNNTVLLTRVPKIPLYVLVSLKGLYALASLVLAGLAVTFTGPSEAQEVKARLTVDGLAAGFFEPAARQEKAVKNLQDLFGEHNKETKNAANDKMGVAQTESGGWVWVTTRVAQAAWQGVDLLVNNAADNGELGRVGQEYSALRRIASE